MHFPEEKTEGCISLPRSNKRHKFGCFIPALYHIGTWVHLGMSLRLNDSHVRVTFGSILLLKGEIGTDKKFRKQS